MIPDRIAKEARALAGRVKSSNDEELLAVALLAAEQRGREMAADELDDLVAVRCRQKINRGNSYIVASASYLRRSRSNTTTTETAP